MIQNYKRLFGLISLSILLNVEAKAVTFKNSADKAVEFSWYDGGESRTLADVQPGQETQVSMDGAFEEIQHDINTSDEIEDVNIYAKFVDNDDPIGVPIGYCEPYVKITKDTNIKNLDKLLHVTVEMDPLAHCKNSKHRH